MRKFLSVAVLLNILLVPFIVFAQAGPLECVRLKRDIEFKGSRCDKATPFSGDPDDICAKGHIVGTKSGYCPMLKAYTNNDDDTMPATWVQGGVDVKLDDDTLTKADITERWSIMALINTIQAVIDWVFTILVVLAVLFVLMGAYNYLTSAGSPEKTKSGRNYILYAAIGLAVAFIARAIPSLVKGIMGY